MTTSQSRLLFAAGITVNPQTVLASIHSYYRYKADIGEVVPLATIVTRHSLFTIANMNVNGSTRTSGAVGSDLLALCRFVWIYPCVLLAIGGLGPTDLAASERNSSQPKSSFEINTTPVSIAPYYYHAPGSGTTNGVTSGDMRAPSLIIAVPLQIDETSSTRTPFLRFLHLRFNC